MVTILDMPQGKAKSDDPLAQGYRLHARTTGEIAEQVDVFLARLKRQGLKFRGRPPKLEPFVNVLVLRFLALPPAEQDRLMLDGIPRFEALLAAGGGLSLDGEMVPPARPRATKNATRGGGRGREEAG